MLLDGSKHSPCINNISRSFVLWTELGHPNPSLLGMKSMKNGLFL
jgi:hypothetical protein